MTCNDISKYVFCKCSKLEEDIIQIIYTNVKKGRRKKWILSTL